jgi:hypothetical protein
VVLKPRPYKKPDVSLGLSAKEERGSKRVRQNISFLIIILLFKWGKLSVTLAYVRNSLLDLLLGKILLENNELNRLK